MKIAVASSLFSRYCLERTFEAASRLGYDGIELWGGRPHAYAPDMDDIAVERICALREKYHLKNPHVCSGVDPLSLQSLLRRRA